MWICQVLACLQGPVPSHGVTCDNRVVRWFALVVVLVGVALISQRAAGWTPPGGIRPTPRAAPGWPLYNRLCLACHGVDGDGRGPAAPWTTSRPRDFTTGAFAWRTTRTGAAPSREDIRRTIAFGARGTSMPAFHLAPADLDRLVDVVLAFAPANADTTPVALVAAPKPDAERGKELWTKLGCVACHGADGTGNPALATTPMGVPYDLTREPLHRPREPDQPLRTAAVLAIATGRDTMPGYAGAAPDADLWALADHVVALQATARPQKPGMTSRSIDADRAARLEIGTWPGSGDEAVVFGGPVPPQGTPPPNLAPAQTSLAPQQCARCHAKQYREWEPSRHHGASSPGLAAQMMGMKTERAVDCLRCHAPLAEQRPETEPGGFPNRLRAQGLSCAGCHVRGWTRHGPPAVSPTLLPIAGYPRTELALYERGDFCMPCHQLPPRTAVAGRPLLDTYREWLEGPYMSRGIQCQHCHMPNREHEFKGIHDPHTFRQGADLTGNAHAATDGAITVVAELGNAGAGHYLPTTPTPAAWLTIELRDARGIAIAGATARLRIGRDISFDGGRWVEHADTRIPPGGRAVLARAWSGGRTGQATTAHLTVEVHPDDYYERLYERRLAGTLVPTRRALYQQALATAKAARYVALTRDLPIAR